MTAFTVFKNNDMLIDAAEYPFGHKGLGPPKVTYP